MVWQAASPIEAAPRMIATFDPCYAQGVEGPGRGSRCSRTTTRAGAESRRCAAGL